MADNVSELTIELEAPAEQADEGLSKLSSALLRLKKAVDDINTGKLEDLKSSIKGFDVSLDAAKGISTFANAMKTLATVTGDFNTKKPQNEVSEFEHSLKAVTDALSTMYGVPRNQFKLLEKQLRDAANSTKDVKEMYQTDLFGTQSVTWADEIAKEIHHTEKVFVEADDAYKELIADIKAANADANGIKLNFSYKELQAENKSIAKTLGQGFTFNDRIDKAQTSFDTWVNGLSESSKVLLGVTDGVTDYAKVFERLVEIKQEYSKGGKIFEVENGSIKDITKSAQEAIDTLRYVKDREIEIHKEEQQTENKFPQHLQEVVDAANGLSVSTETGAALKELGNGFKVIANSIKKLSDVDTGKLHEIVSAVSSVGSTLGNLGSNNKVSIKISSDGVKGSVKALESVESELEELRQKAQQSGQAQSEVAQSATSEIDEEIRRRQEAVNRLNELIEKQREYASIILGMERGTAGVDVDVFIKARDALSEVNKQIQELAESMGKKVEFATADSIAQKLTPIINEIQKYKNLVSDMDKGNIAFDEEQYIEAKRKIEELTKEYRKFSEELSKKLRTTGLDGLSQTMQGVIDKQKELQQLISGMDSGQIGFDWKQYQKATVELDKMTNAQAAFRKLASLGTPKGLDMLGDSFKVLGKQLNGLSNFGIKAFKIIATPFSAIGASIKKHTSKITAHFTNMSKNVQATLKKMSDFWKRTMRTFTFMLVRKAIDTVIKDMREAVDSLALFSKMIGTGFNDSISNAVADFKYMGRAILGAVEPLINFIVPILDRVAEAFANVAGKVAQFMAALTGQSYWMKAKKNVVDYASSVDKAGKAAKGSLQSFDELNNITTQSNSDSIDPEGYKKEWEKMPVSEQAKKWADAIKKIFSDLWEPIGKAWDKMKDYVLSGWKYMTTELKSLAKDMWKDFIEVWKQEATVKIFENIFGIVGDLEYTIGNLAKRFHEAWNENKTGKKILENIRDIVGTLVQHVRNVTMYMVQWSNTMNFKPLLTTFEQLTKSANKVADFIGYEFEDVMKLGVLKFIKWFIEKGLPNINMAVKNVIDAFDFAKIRKNIQPVILGVEQLLEHLIGGITKAGENLGKKIAEWFNSDKFTKFTEALAKIMAVFTEDRIATVLEGIGTAFLHIAESIADIISSDSVAKLFEGIGKWIDEKGVEGIAKAIEDLGNAILGLKVAAIVFAGIGTAVKTFAKIKMVADIAGIAKSMKDVSTAADGASKVSVFTKALEGLNKIKTGAVTKITEALGKLGSIEFGGASLKALFTTDLAELIGSGGATAGATIGATIASSIAAAIGGYFAGNKLGKLINPDDADLYDRYKLGGEGNIFKDVINTNESALDNLKDMLDGAERMMTDFKDNPVVATVASLLGGGFGIYANIKNAVTSGDNPLKATIDSAKETMISAKEDIVGAFVLIAQDVSDALDGIKNKFQPVIDIVTQFTDLVKGSLYASVLSVKASFILLGESITTALGKLGEIINANVIEPIKTLAIIINTTVIEPIKAGFTEAWNVIQSTIGQAFTFLSTTVITPLTELINSTIDSVMEKVNVTWTFLTSLFSVVTTTIEDTILIPLAGRIDTFVTDIQTKFTTLWDGIKAGVKACFNGVLGIIEKVLNGIATGLNVIIGGINLVGSSAAKVTHDPWTDLQEFKTITIPRFASGGFPEDGLFMANHNELIGKFDNGQTAVANNDQITTGIANAVSNANAESNALMRQMVVLMEQFVDKDFTIGDDAVYSSYKRGEARYTKRYGY